MDALQFVYWLQGFMELADPNELDSTQVHIIKDHLALVLTKISPNQKDAPWSFPLWGGVSVAGEQPSLC